MKCAIIDGRSDLFRIMVMACAMPLGLHDSLARAQCPMAFGFPTNHSGGVLSTMFDVALCDLNGDGNLDIVTANPATNNVSILLGNGSGTFLPSVTYGTGTFPMRVVVTDFNNDNRFDLATSNYNSNDISVLLGNGNGTFQSAGAFPAGVSPYSLAAADFNHDGDVDVVTGNEGASNVSVLLGNGDGTFQASATLPVVNTARTVASGDLNGDGHADIVATIFGAGRVALILGNGDGTFQPSTSFFTNSNPQFVGIFELSGDEHPDLVVVRASGNNNVALYLGNGDGTFSTGPIYTAGISPASDAPQSATLADVNGDGRPDLIVAVRTASLLDVLPGNGNGTFAAPVHVTTSSAPSIVVAGDVDGDGRPDLAATSGPNIAVNLNQGTSAFIRQQPANQMATAGQDVTFNVSALGATAYRWRREGVPLANGGRFSGVTTHTFTISNVSIADAGVYDVLLSASCKIGNPSKPAALTVTPCRGDFNSDYVFDGQDIQSIVEALLAGETCP